MFGAWDRKWGNLQGYHKNLAEWFHFLWNLQSVFSEALFASRHLSTNHELYLPKRQVKFRILKSSETEFCWFYFFKKLL